LTVNRMG